MRLEDSVIIVTGGANGLGKAITDTLLDKSAKVVVLDINKDSLSSLQDNNNLLKIECDITKEEEVANAINSIKEKFSMINVLVNNAGILYSEPLVNITSENKRHSLSSWQKVIDINLTAQFLVTSYIVEHMVMNRIKGLIINISSISARGNAGQSAYSAAKAGVEALTKVWAKELGAYGIRSVAIAPGFIDTDSTHKAINEKTVEEWKKKIPLKTLGNVKHITQGINFAIQNDHLNGTVIEINGGLVL